MNAATVLTPIVRRLCLLVLLTLPSSLAAQYGPPVGDGRYDDSSATIFLDDELTQIEVTMDPADLQAIIDDPLSDEYKTATVRVFNSQIDETVTDVGIRARGNTARFNMKFPWKLSFNEFVPGRRFHGVKKFNLASDAGDPSLSRSKVLWDAYRAMGVPASRASYVRMVINDGSQVDGVYLNIEQVDDDFVDAWFGNEDGALYKCRFKDIAASLRYIAPGTPETYAAFDSYEEELRDGDFVGLAELIDFVDRSDDATFRAEIGDRVNVEGLLRAQAADIASGNWDGYWFGGNNYYLYQNTETQRFEYMPWDLDQAFGMDYWFFPIFFGENWATRDYEGWADPGFGGYAPLVERILEIPEYEQQFQRLIREAAEGPLSIGANEEKLDQIKTLLEPFIFRGSFSGPTMDNGFEPHDFLEGFDQPDDYSPFAGATWGIKPFLRVRQEYVRDNYPDPPALPRLRINEVVADNESVLADEAGEFEDYLEIFNDDPSIDADLGGMYLTDRAGNPRGWRIPAGTIVPAKGFVLVWADEDVGQGPLHADFRLSNEGEGVWLFDVDERLNVRLDSLVFPALADDEAFGRTIDGTPLIATLAAPSPEAANVDPDAPFGLGYSGVCPGPLTFYGSGSVPGSQIGLVAAAAPGNAQVPTGSCTGTELGLAAPLVPLGLSAADALGKSELELLVPEALCSSVVVQALDTADCSTSETLSDL